MKLCKEISCDKEARNGGYCWMHYSRLYRHGDLNFRLRNANGEGNIHHGRKRITLGERRVQEAVLVVERVLGKQLPKGAVVHHINEDKMDNSHSNLVVCQNQGLHNIIHGRIKALNATGNARSKPCRFCHRYELPEDINSKLKKNGTNHYHLECARIDAKERRINHESL